MHATQSVSSSATIELGSKQALLKPAMLAWLAVLLLAVPIRANAVVTGELAITSPLQGTYIEGTHFNVMEFSGLGDVTAAVAGVDLFGGTSGCTAADFAGFPAGYIALMEKSLACSFAVQATNALAAGAAAVLIYNSAAGLIFGTLQPPVALPVMGVEGDLGFELANTPGLTMRVTVADVPAIPEPATLALFGLGLAGLGAMRRKKLAA